MVNKIDLTGQRFGRLVAIKIEDKKKNKRVTWECICDCGEKTFVSVSNLKNKHVTSCGCYRKEMLSERTTRLHISMIESKKGKSLVEKTDLSNLNRKINKNNKSGTKGVSFDNQSKKWRAYICLKGKQMKLGCFKNKQDAINARKEAEDKYFKPILDKYGKS